MGASMQGIDARARFRALLPSLAGTALRSVVPA
jgi:hypothetical protein